MWLDWLNGEMDKLDMDGVEWAAAWVAIAHWGGSEDALGTGWSSGSALMASGRKSSSIPAASTIASTLSFQSESATIVYYQLR